jgi:hypothetical protein
LDDVERFPSTELCEHCQNIRESVGVLAAKVLDALHDRRSQVPLPQCFSRRLDVSRLQLYAVGAREYDKRQL